MKKNTKNTYDKIPVITLRGAVIFPGSKMHFDIIRRQSILALEKAIKQDQKVFFVTQKDFTVEEPDVDEIYDVGVIANILQMTRIDSEEIKILIEIQEKAKIIDIQKTNGFFEASVEIIKNNKYKSDIFLEGLIKTAKDLFGRYCGLIKNMPEEVVMSIMNSDDPIFVVESIASNTMINIDVKQEILVSCDVVEKIELLVEELSYEFDLMLIEKDVLDKLHSKIDQSQREYYLREQMKIISQELGEDIPLEEKYKYQDKIDKLKIKDKEIKNKLLDEVDKLSRLPYNSPESSIIKTYLDTCLGLPWNKVSKDRIDIEKSKKILDKDHYGLEDVKERILEFLSVVQLKKEVNGLVLCLCGPPGVGKTSIAKSIAKTVNRKFAQISLGGVKDESDIRGHRKTYIGSMPGRIINAIKTAGVKNPLILLDEIDKMSSDFRGDPASAMLEVLDIEQNKNFVDHYLEIPFDLSNVLFIATANDKYSIPAPLLDRMEIIDITSYTENEKFNIAKNHLVSKQIKLNALSSQDVKISDQAILEIINYYTAESGVRELERKIARILRKIAKKKLDSSLDSNKKTIITDKNLIEYLGPRKFKANKLLDKNEIGIATGLAWTSVGGEVMHIEVSALSGSGKIELTGNLGDVMKESARTAISYVRSRSKDFGIDEDFYKNKDIHIHAPEGGIPKDGPSAGVTICTALVSELTKKPVKKDIAMTGEITLRGRVLPIGGLKEKTMAAYNTGVKTVFIPKENEPDLYEIDPVVRESVKFIAVDKIESILNEVLI